MRVLAALALSAALCAVALGAVLIIGYHVNAALEGAQALSGAYTPPAPFTGDEPWTP